MSGRLLLAGLLLACLAARAAADRAVALDGSIREASEIVVDLAAGTAKLGRGQATPLAEYLLLEKSDGTLLWAPDLEARLRSYENLARRERLELSVGLLREAFKLQDEPHVRTLLEWAKRDGMDVREAQRAENRLRSLEARPLDRPDARREAIAERMRLIPELHATFLVARALAEPDGNRGSLQLLREALGLRPEHAQALEATRARMPEGFALGGPAYWLAWKLEVESRGAALLPPETPSLRAWAAGWRADLIGIESGPLHLVTPVRDPVLLGRIIACGRLTCRVLEETFATEGDPDRQTAPMQILLFENREEYLERCVAPGDAEGRAFLEWSAGHYSPSEHVSRFFWHADRDAERRLISTFVHEVTHHWMEQCHPRYSRRDLRSSVTTPAYWIVEGLANFMQEGSYDLDGATCSLEEPRARSLDIVASLAGSRHLVPWEALYRLDQAGFRGLPGPREQGFVRRWSLVKEAISLRSNFYSQGAATCHFLYHAEKGRHRAALLDYAVAYYTGQKEALSIRKAFGMSAAELGAKVVAYATAVSRGG